MKIATWNLERPRKSATVKNAKIIESLNKIDADVLILTETNSLIHPGDLYYPFSTTPLAGIVSGKGEIYREGENRVTIWTKYPRSQSLKTYDPFTSICMGLDTPLGKLIIYGTVIGIFGNRDKGFDPHLKMQLADWRGLSKLGNICIAGDFNISFADGYYYTKAGRNQIDDCFRELKIDLPTRGILNNIDHIAISDPFLNSVDRKTETWNEDKTLSDHIGVCLTLS
jgi:endonuclease/exonuclease/phosphatase family metal-dependent hydrolase